jgi:hypothetical protein
MLQELDSELNPRQVVPPLEGEGLLQSLVLNWFPPPHVVLQVPQELQAPQFPSETQKKQYFGTAFFTFTVLKEKYNNHLN